jgi:hypothetical protein
LSDITLSGVAALLCLHSTQKRQELNGRTCAIETLALFITPEINRPLTQAVLTLPPWFAVVAAGATIAVTIAASATATTTTAITATAAAVTTAASMSAAWTAIGARARFIHRQVTTAEIFAVKLIDCGGRLFRRGHLDKAKASRAACHAIFDNLRRLNIAYFRKVIPQVITGSLERKVPDIESCSHFYL